MRFILLLFIIVPVLEMWLLITVGQRIGALPTIGLVLLTAVIGVNLLRAQGFSTLVRAQQKMASGSLPAEEMLEGLALGIGGALLLTPGFVTDAFGFACLIPLSRRLMVAKLLKSGLLKVAGFSGAASKRSSVDSVIIEGEYSVEGEREGETDREKNNSLDKP